MGIEIERKFLVIGNAWRAEVTRSEAMDQGYLAQSEGNDTLPGCSVRVRRGGVGAYLNVKSREAGERRLEFEFPIDAAVAGELLTAFCRERIVKVRHHILRDNAHWEVDEFGGDNDGLVVAEIEIPTIDEQIALPEWIGIELTHQARFYNSALVGEPFATWADRKHWLELIKAC